MESDLIHDRGRGPETVGTRILVAVIVAGLVAVPLAVAFAADQEQTGKTSPKDQQTVGAHTAILRGRVTNEAGAPLGNVRVRVAIPAADMRFVDSTTPHKQLEAKSNTKGEYQLEIPGITMPTTISIDAMKPGYHRLGKSFLSGSDPKSVEVAPGATAEASLILKPALYVAGVVVDEEGKPISGVRISANAAFGTAWGAVESTASRSDGSFELFNYPVSPRVIQNELTRGLVSFFRPDYLPQGIEDIYALARTEREALRIVLERGHQVTGTVIDVTGRPVLGAMVKVAREDGNLSFKATMTDANGKFALRALGEGRTMLYARARGYPADGQHADCCRRRSKRHSSPTETHFVARRPEEALRARHAARRRDSALSDRLANESR